MSPTDACLEALQRVVRNYKPYPERLRQVDLEYYALNKDGVYGSATLWRENARGRRREYAVHDGTQARLLPCTPLFDRASDV